MRWVPGATRFRRLEMESASWASGSDRRWRFSAALLLVTLVVGLLSGCTEDGVLRGSVVLEGSHELAPGAGHVAVLGGTARLPGGIVSDGTIVLLGDALFVEGRVGGDVMVLGGRAEFGPDAIVDGSIVVAGGDVAIDPGASVRGGVREDLDLLAEWAQPAPTVGDRLSTMAIQGFLLAGLAWLVAAAAPGAVRRISDAVAEHTAVAGAMGVLAGLVASVLLVIMAFTVVLIPVTLVAALVLLIAIALGWISLGRGLAIRYARSRGRTETRPLAVAGWTLVVMAGLTAMEWVPVVGPIAALLVTVAGFGAVLITGFGTRRFVPDLGSGADRVRAGGEVPPGKDG